MWYAALIGSGSDFQADETIMVGSRQRIQRSSAVWRNNLRHIGFVGWTDSCAGRRKISQGGTFNINPLIVRISFCGQSKVAGINRAIVQDDGLTGLRHVERELKGRTGVDRPCATLDRRIPSCIDVNLRRGRVGLLSGSYQGEHRRDDDA